ncbi:membrane protein [Achromobacter piechaudii]|uniref:DUF4142 domain-containing protein n=1 Tax=Achromobacter piechaudii TaxID=72556 RepID=UPI000682DA47|nr:DUF4142 domain-containing protein [Achromobacter piechaudii]KNY11005.1 membrane protein [Achromobacter piechaudii]
MKTRTLTAALLSIAVLGAGTTALAQQTAPATPAAPMASDSKLDSKDRDFLENAAQSGHMEVEGSKLALKKSQNAEVKSFAQKMIDDHGKAGEKLAALAKSKGYDAPTEPSLMQQAKLKTLGLRDEGFDKAYAEGVGVSAHEDAVKLFEEASNQAKDPEIKQFATETLPTLQQHLQMAKTLEQSVKKAP